MKKAIVLAIGLALIATVALARTQRTFIHDSKGRTVGFFTYNPNGKSSSETWNYPDSTGFSDFYGDENNPFGAPLKKRKVGPDEKGWVPLWMREGNGEE